MIDHQETVRIGLLGTDFFFLNFIVRFNAYLPIGGTGRCSSSDYF